MDPPALRRQIDCFCMRHSPGFTLFELLLAVAIGLLIVFLSVPSVVGVFKDNRLTESFNRFDEFVQGAHDRAVTNHKDLVLVWVKDGIDMIADNPDEGGTDTEPEHYSPGEATITLDRPAAMAKNPPSEWIFWHSGICEPAVITYHGPEGAWKAAYDPLTGRGTILDRAYP